MNRTPKETIMCRKVASLLQQFVPNIDVTFSNSGLYDLTVEEHSENVRFGVEVVTQEIINDHSFDEYLGKLLNYQYSPFMEKLPILLMCLDPGLESLQWDLLLSWEEGKQQIHRERNLKGFTADSWTEVIGIVKEEDSIIRVLSDSKICIIKRLFVNAGYLGRKYNAYFCYLRRFTDDYKMKNEENLSEQERFNRILNGIPEESYPSDLLDEMIINAVNLLYPNVKTNSKVLLLNSELKELRREVRQQHRIFQVFVQPDVNTIPSHLMGIINGMPILNLPLQLFYTPLFEQDAFREASSTISLPFQEWEDTYSTLHRLRAETFMDINEVL